MVHEQYPAKCNRRIRRDIGTSQGRPCQKEKWALHGRYCCIVCYQCALNWLFGMKRKKKRMERAKSMGCGQRSAKRFDQSTS